MGKNKKRKTKAYSRLRYGLIGTVAVLIVIVGVICISRTIQANEANRYNIQPPGEEDMIYDTSMAPAIMKKYLQNSIVAAGADNSAWVQNGRVTVIGQDDYEQCATEEWSNIIAIALGDDHIIGLTADGSLVFAGDNSYGQCDLQTNGVRVVSIAASSWGSFAVLEDGRVFASGNAVVNNAELYKERNVAVVAASDSHVVLLKKDGSLTVYGDSYMNQAEISGCKEIVSVACGYDVVVAMEKSGTVHVIGDTAYGQKALDGTVNANNIAAGGNFCIVSLNDGTVIGAGSNSKGQIDVANWNKVQAIACGYMHAVAIYEDGSRIYSGSNNHGQQE